nr:hypothetical protein BaRGS_021781 [Batillaria attramentaria]
MFVKEEFVLLRQKFAFIPGAFVNETLPTDETVTLVQSDNMTLSSLNKSFLCDVQRTVQFGSLNSEDYSYSMMQDISSLHVQAFGIADDKYSPAEECALDTTTEATTEPSTTIQATSEPSSDAATTLEPITTEATTEPNTTPKPTTQPSTPTPFPTLPTPLNPNTYMVYGTNATCIVFKAIISFSGFTYTQSGGGTGETDDIFIPFFGVASGIAVNGSCGNDTSSIQTMSIEFNGNWTLFLMFERSDAADDRKHGAKDEFSLREIQLTYYLSSQFFNDALQQGKVQTASQTNMKDFMKGQLGGSYKCDAEMTRTLSNGVIFKTKDLQYKAFSTDAGTDFSTDQVSECAAEQWAYAENLM